MEGVSRAAQMMINTTAASELRSIADTLERGHEVYQSREVCEVAAAILREAADALVAEATLPVDH